jgi:hypothetical protein
MYPVHIPWDSPSFLSFGIEFMRKLLCVRIVAPAEYVRIGQVVREAVVSEEVAQLMPPLVTHVLSPCLFRPWTATILQSG